METKKTKRKLDLHTLQVGESKTFKSEGNHLSLQSSLCVSAKNVSKKVEGFKVKTNVSEDKSEVSVTRLA